MKTKYISGKDKWGIVLCYDLKRLDEYKMRQMMMSFGMRGSKLDEAIDVLLFHENTGMCISRDGIKMSLIFIGNATSEDQYWDTVVHELTHATIAICDHYDIWYTTEDFAWTLGYLTRKAVQLTAPPCL